MTEAKLVVSDRNGHCATLILNRPESLNSLSPALVAAMVKAVESVATSDARVLVIKGAGRAFSAGADLKAVQAPDFTRDDARKFSADARRLTHLMETMPQVVIASVHGYCFTGGLEIFLAADLMIASEDAVFADTHARIGRTPAWGLSQRLPRRIGVMRAKEMSFTARRVTAREAAAIGLILEAVPTDMLADHVAALASSISENDPLSLSAYKDLYRQSQSLGLDAGLSFEAATRYARTSSSKSSFAS